MSTEENIAGVAGVAEARMRGLVDAGAAHPLMADHWPVPVRWLDQWWYVPTASATVEGQAAAPVAIRAFERAPEVIAQQCDRLGRRYAAAAAAVVTRTGGAGDRGNP